MNVHLALKQKQEVFQNTYVIINYINLKAQKRCIWFI